MGKSTIRFIVIKETVKESHEGQCRIFPDQTDRYWDSAARNWLGCSLYVKTATSVTCVEGEKKEAAKIQTKDRMTRKTPFLKILYFMSTFLKDCTGPFK